MMNFLQDIFSQVPFTPEEKVTVFSKFERIELKKGTILLREGEIAADYYLVEEGLIRSYAIDLNGKDITTRFYDPAQIAMNSSSIFLKMPSQEFMVCVTDILCWRIKFEASDELFDTIEPYRKWGRGRLVENLYGYKKRRLDLITLSAAQRYDHLLKSQPMVVQFVPLKHIASYLGIANATLSRIRKEI